MNVYRRGLKTQIWIAVSVYVLVAIVRKRLGLEANLYRILRGADHQFFGLLGPLPAWRKADDGKRSSAPRQCHAVAGIANTGIANT